MKPQLFLLLICLLSLWEVKSVNAPLKPTVEDGSINITNYERTFFDDFNGPLLDQTQWKVELGSKNGAISTAQNVRFSMNCLVLYGNWNGVNFTQGRIQSLRYFDKGFFEARFRTSGSNGWHPALWLAPLNVYPPPFWNQEIDFMEMNTYNHRYVTHTMHAWSNGTTWTRLPQDILFWKSNFNVPAMNETFQIIGCQWTSTHLRIFWNGQLWLEKLYPREIWSNPLQWMISQSLQPWSDPRFPFDFSALPNIFWIDYAAYFEDPLSCAN